MVVLLKTNDVQLLPDGVCFIETSSRVLFVLVVLIRLSVSDHCLWSVSQQTASGEQGDVEYWLVCTT